MDDNRKTVKVSSARVSRPAASARSSAPSRRSAGPSGQRPRPSQKKTVQKTKSKSFTAQTALIIAIAAVIVICVPLILITTSATAKPAAEQPEAVNTLIAPVTAVPGENSTVAQPEQSTESTDPESQSSTTVEAKTYQRNDEDPEIARIQQRLMDLGYMGKAEPTELFGPATEESVKLFQSLNDIASDGIATPETQNALFSEQAVAFALSEGMENIVVSQLQSKLKKLGYLSANATGYYGSATTTAVRNFQKTNGLDADGKVGISTWSKLNSSSAVKAPDPTPTPSTAPTTAPEGTTE